MKYVAIALLSAAVTASAEMSAMAALDVDAVLGGEIWRLLSGHLCHLSWKQYVCDAPAFVALQYLYEKRAGAAAAMQLLLVAAITVSGAVVAAGVHEVYGGLSGVTCASLAVLIVNQICADSRSYAGYLLGALLVGYLLIPQGSLSGVHVAREAHVAGTLTGALFALGIRRMAGVMVERSSGNRARPLSKRSSFI